MKIKQIIGISTLAIALTIGYSGLPNASASPGIALDPLSVQSHLVSTDGRYIVFVSQHSGIVANDTNNRADVFRLDRTTNTSVRINMKSNGNESLHNVNKVSMSNNGRYITFSTRADLLNTFLTDSYDHIYLKDMKANTLELIQAGSPFMAMVDAVSEDGRFVYFSKDGTTDSLWVKDRLLNTTSQVDVNNSNTVANGSSWSLDSTCDGRYVTFGSEATNLTANDTNGNNDIFLIDRMGTNRVVNITSSSNGNSNAAEISCDGNYLLFSSEASNLVSGDTNGVEDIFKYDVANDEITRVSIDSNGNQFGGYSSSNGGIGTWDMTMDGRYAVFTAHKSNAITIYVRDTQAATTTAYSSTSGGYAQYPALSQDGSKMFYTYDPYTLYPGRLSLAEDFLN